MCLYFYVKNAKPKDIYFQIYLTGYIGCYIDAGDRAMPDVHTRVDRNLGCSIQQCITKCRAKNHQYAGLQYFDHCFCSNSYDKHGPGTEASCNTPCHDGTSRMCGGGWRNSVYRTGK